MENNMVIKCADISFFSKQILNMKINNSIRECQYIKEILKREGELDNQDDKLNLIIPHSSLEIKSKYFLFKGYHNDGSLKPLKKYTLRDGKPLLDEERLLISVSVVDIYEKSVYLYNYSKDDKFIEGFMIKDERRGKARTLIFSLEKVKILLKNINSITTYEEVEEFVNRIIL